MKVKTVSIEYKRKLNLGDFNSADIGCSIWAELEENEEVEIALSELTELARKNVKDRALPLLHGNKNVGSAEFYQEYFQGKPVKEGD